MKAASRPYSAPTASKASLLRRHTKSDDVQKYKERATGCNGLRNMAVPLHHLQSVGKFDLMQISITVYNLSGILAKPRRRGWKLDLSNCFRRRSRETKDTDSSGVTENTSSDSVEMESRHGIPTTAVVSCCRQAISSSTSSQTLLPSLPLVRASRKGGTGTVSYSAMWRSDDGLKLKRGQKVNSAHLESSTFKVIRAMKQNSYRPETPYLVETVDLNVAIGRGCDVIPVGFASLAVTGDEEGEVIMNLPVKQGQSKSTMKPKRSGKDKKSRRRLCSATADRFSLAENATLRVGVRVLPHEAMVEADKLAIEMNEYRGTLSDDENSLMEKRSTKHEDDQGFGCTTLACRPTIQTPTEMFSRAVLGCFQPDNDNVFTVLTLENDTPGGCFLSDASNSRAADDNGKTALFPYSIMSSVSESTDGGTMETDESTNYRN